MSLNRICSAFSISTAFDFFTSAERRSSSFFFSDFKSTEIREIKHFYAYLLLSLLVFQISGIPLFDLVSSLKSSKNNGTQEMPLVEVADLHMLE